MAKTRTDLIHRALKNLGVLPQGSDPSDDVYDSVDEHVDPMLASLAQLDVVNIKNAEEIDDEYFLPLGHILADTVKAEFGAVQDVNLLALAEAAKRDLKTMQSTKPTYAVLKTTYF